ncbi:Tubulin-specific chaperone E [Gryllus bimaculatus]|nr:Tubulin-specific chaperone E [Gryllus bimaculatus]
MMVGSSLNGKAMPTENPFCLKIGQRVEYMGYFGTLMFVGEVPPTKGTWLGIDWDDPSRGKHNGTHEGKFYFHTRHMTSGSFVRFGKVNFGHDCATAIHNRYGEVKGETAGVDKSNLEILKKNMKAPLFEVVGFDKVNRKQSQFDKLTVVCLKEELVNGSGAPGELKNLCPRIAELDLSRNLLNSWEVVAEIAQQLTDLWWLNTSENRLTIPEKPAHLKDSFPKIKHIVAGRMEYTWSEILSCCSMWPGIQTLQVPFNHITQISVPPHVLENLKVLDLEGNCIEDWGEINKIGKLPSLESLNVCNTGLIEINFPVEESGNKTELFSSLKQLYLTTNKIQKWESVSELDKLKQLEELRFHENPVLYRENHETSRQLVIARIGRLQKLNGIVITPEERKGAEYDYLKKHGQEWIDMNKKENVKILMENFVLAHPRYPALIQKYGAPEEGVEIFSPKMEGKVYKKKLPLNMSVQKLIGLVQRLYNTGSEVPYLTYISSKYPDIEAPLENVMKEIAFYSVEDGDRIAVHWN